MPALPGTSMYRRWTPSETTAISPYDIPILYYAYSNTLQIAYAYIHTYINIMSQKTFSLYA